MEKFDNKYRIASCRAPWWDYGRNGSYFITICTHNRTSFFGNIHHGRMYLSAAGRVATSNWFMIPGLFPFSSLGAFVVMPNHIHGIINLHHIHEMNQIGGIDGTVPDGYPEPMGGCTGMNNPMMRENIPRIIRWYKGRTTYETRKMNPEFKWQERYHDHIIRNSHEYRRISLYIIHNPIHWKSDRFSS